MYIKFYDDLILLNKHRQDMNWKDKKVKPFGWILVYTEDYAFNNRIKNSNMKVKWEWNKIREI